MPPRPVRRPANPDAGPAIHDERATLAPVPAPAAVPAAEQTSPKKVRMIRQTLDLPSEQYDQLHDEVRRFARDSDLTSRDLNAQRVLRALVARVLTDDELRHDVFQDAARSVAT